MRQWQTRRWRKWGNDKILIRKVARKIEENYLLQAARAAEWIQCQQSREVAVQNCRGPLKAHFPKAASCTESYLLTWSWWLATKTREVLPRQIWCPLTLRYICRISERFYPMPWATNRYRRLKHSSSWTHANVLLNRFQTTHRLLKQSAILLKLRAPWPILIIFSLLACYVS